MSKQEPLTGKFAKGNPGRPKGSKNKRTLQWNAFGDALVTEHSARFTDTLEALWDSEDLNDQIRAAELFLKMLEYFKPKMPREAPLTDLWNLNNLLR